MEPRKEEVKKKRFRLVKLEERVVPSHLPAVAQVVVATPAVDNAPTHAHKVDFFASFKAAASGKNCCPDDASC